MASCDVQLHRRYSSAAPTRRLLGHASKSDDPWRARRKGEGHNVTMLARSGVLRRVNSSYAPCLVTVMWRGPRWRTKPICTRVRIYNGHGRTGRDPKASSANGLSSRRLHGRGASRSELGGGHRQSTYRLCMSGSEMSAG